MNRRVWEHGLETFSRVVGDGSSAVRLLPKIRPISRVLMTDKLFGLQKLFRKCVRTFNPDGVVALSHRHTGVTLDTATASCGKA